MPGPWLAVLDWLLPPHCPSCGREVAVQDTFCAACFAALNFVVEPLCDSCGLPFAVQTGARVCEGCRLRPPPWRRARAALVYDDASRRLILPLKHADRQELAGVLAAHMVRAGQTLLAHTDVLVPVPLHRWRLFRRGFNQSALLAQEVARRAGRDVCLNALRRNRRTRQLGTLSAGERAEALDGALEMRPGQAAQVRGRRVLLIDDVLTSGATARACTKALLDAGAQHVDLLVASRVPDPRWSQFAEPDDA